MDFSCRLDQPIFQDVPLEITEDWDWGVLIGGMAEEHSKVAIARAYKLAGDDLVSRALENGQAYETSYPILFVYRHAIELYLKDIVQSKKRTHKLDRLVEEFRQYCSEILGQQIPSWVGKRLREFDVFDPGATTFRYENRRPEVRNLESWVDLHHLRCVMEALCQGFERILISRPT